MEKEFYKLFLVVIMIISSFSLAFFLGRKITLSEQQLSQQSFEEGVQDSSEMVAPSQELSNEVKEQPEIPSTNEVNTSTDTAVADSVSNLDGTSTQRAEVQDYQKQLPDSSDIYGLLVDSFLTKEPAMERSTNLKLKFPEWPIFFKKAGSVYKVYFGPFDDIQIANDFLKEVKASGQFPSVILEKVIKKNDSQ